MSKANLAPAKGNPKDFSLHLPDKVLTEKELEARFKNLKKLVAQAKKQANQNQKSR